MTSHTQHAAGAGDLGARNPKPTTRSMVVRGDGADPRFTIDVTRGVQVIYQTLNPPYSRWVEEFPALQAGVLAAAQAHGARLVSMENVYMSGRPAGRPGSEHFA
jgi:hypothetical protein